MYKHVYRDFTKDEKTVPARTLFVVKKRKEPVTDLEKCCTTT